MWLNSVYDRQINNKNNKSKINDKLAFKATINEIPGSLKDEFLVDIYNNITVQNEYFGKKIDKFVNELRRMLDQFESYRKYYNLKDNKDLIDKGVLDVDNMEIVLSHDGKKLVSPPQLDILFTDGSEVILDKRRVKSNLRDFLQLRETAIINQPSSQIERQALPQFRIIH